MKPLLSIHVPGTPKPKGSLRHVGKGRMVEQLAGSPDWRTAVVTAAYGAIHDADGFLPKQYPYLGAVKVTIVLELPRPAKPKDPHYPSGGNTGDVDKHARNILDALQDAGVVRNDSQVVDLAVAKRWTTYAPGAHITVWPVTAESLDPLPRGAEPGSPPRDGARDKLPPEWAVDHPGLGIYAYHDEDEARLAAGTAGTLLHHGQATP